MLKRLATVSFAVLLLCSGAKAGNYTDNHNGTISDANTGLTWQQGEGGSKTWKEALEYCRNPGADLPGTGWRLPNISELESLVEPTKAKSPIINTDMFPDANPSYYWSSAASAYNPAGEWNVVFSIGGFSFGYRTGSVYVRCVR